MERHDPAPMQQRSNNDPGPTQQPTTVNLAFALFEKHDPAPMQQRSNNDPGLNPHLKHVNITFVIVGKTRSSTDAATVQQRSMTEPFPQT